MNDLDEVTFRLGHGMVENGLAYFRDAYAHAVLQDDKAMIAVLMAAVASAALKCETLEIMMGLKGKAP
jgi:hypothetical protein